MDQYINLNKHFGYMIDLTLLASYFTQLTQALISEIRIQQHKRSVRYTSIRLWSSIFCCKLE